jgi:hypothetical protein
LICGSTTGISQRFLISTSLDRKLQMIMVHATFSATVKSKAMINTQVPGVLQSIFSTSKAWQKIHISLNTATFTQSTHLSQLIWSPASTLQIVNGKKEVLLIFPRSITQSHMYRETSSATIKQVLIRNLDCPDHCCQC